MAEKMIARKFFEDNDNGEFDSYSELEEAAQKFFKQHLTELPAEYRPRNLLELGERKRWILLSKGKRFQIRFEPDDVRRIADPGSNAPTSDGDAPSAGRGPIFHRPIS